MSAIDIPLVLKKNYPTAKWGGSAATYDLLVWKDTTIPKPTLAELQAQWNVIDLEYAKMDKIKELSDACEAEILGGFQSSALGTPYWYGGTQEDQLNLIGVVASGQPSPFSVKKNKTDIQKTYINHTAAQLQQVMYDGKMFKLQLLQKFNNLKDQVLAATDIQTVQSFVW